jgi:hypothetical protein
VSEADLSWRPWSAAEVARRLSGVTATWCVAGGWAVDLHLGQVTREHEDLEIADPAAGFDQVRGALDDAQRGWLARSLTVVHPGHPWIAAVAGRGA